IAGELNRAAFESAWRLAFERHPILRASFHWEDLDHPLQVVHQKVPLPLEYYDWRELPPNAQQESLETLLAADCAQGFEIEKSPLTRLYLIQIGAQCHQFVWSYHHLILDGWSKSLLLKEVFSLYDALCHGRAIGLKPSTPYRNYITWIKEQDMAAAEAFLPENLKGFTTPTPLTIRGAERSAQNSAYAIREAQIPDDVTTSLLAFGRQQGLTLNTLVQGAWGVLLSRYSGEDDIVFGATVAGRPPGLPDAENIIGLFINTLPVRVRVVGEEPLLPWLKRLQAQVSDLRQYEYSPLVQIQGWSELQTGSPLFQSLLVFENYSVIRDTENKYQSVQLGDVSFVERNNYPLSL